jgi:mRNA-degrading endonuclease RelE of RelBE toxin-antitoxin system
MERRGPCQNCGKTSMPDDSANLVQVEFTPEFKRNLRQLTKKYRHLQADVQPVIAQLESGQTPGTQIPRTGYTVFKVRIKNSDIQKGKRSGYRMIYYLKTPKLALLITIYSKTEQGDVSAEQIRHVITEYESQSQAR